MAFTLVRSPSTLWVAATTILYPELEKFTAQIMAAINATRGGTWAPLTQIDIRGSGLVLTGPLVIRGAGAYLRSVSTGTWTVSDGDFPELGASHTGRTQKEFVACGRGVVLSPTTTLGSAVHLVIPRDDCAMQLIAHAVQPLDKAPVPMRFRVRLRGHNGAKLTTLTVSFRVPQRHEGIAPVTMPKVRVFRADASGTITLLTSVAAGADASGYVSVPRVTSGVAWYASGAKQTLVVACDQNNTVDVATYRYFVEVVEEQGLTGFPWRIWLSEPCKAKSTGNIVLSGTQVIDAISLGAADRCLLNDQTDPAENGPWFVRAGAWDRADEMNRAEFFQLGLLVPVQRGTVGGGTLWQLKTAVTVLDTDAVSFATRAADPDAPSEAAELAAYGNIWQSVQADYANIASIAWQ